MKPEAHNKAVADQLALANNSFVASFRQGAARLPEIEKVHALLDTARSLFFTDLLPPGQSVKDALKSFQRKLGKLIGAAYQSQGLDTPEGIVKSIIAELPEMQKKLQRDAHAAYQGDPALRRIDEAILSYPGLRALCHHRLAHALYTLDVPLLPRMISELAHSETGIDIHPGAQIGERFFIDHGTGVVIGETAVIGNDVRIYQGVTLGARRFEKDDNGALVKGVPRHPTVGDGVVIYANASVLGRITIGNGAIIGGNVSVTEDIGPGVFLTQQKARQERFSYGGGI